MIDIAVSKPNPPPSLPPCHIFLPSQAILKAEVRSEVTREKTATTTTTIVTVAIFPSPSHTAGSLFYLSPVHTKVYVEGTAKKRSSRLINSQCQSEYKAWQSPYIGLVRLLLLLLMMMMLTRTDQKVGCLLNLNLRIARYRHQPRQRRTPTVSLWPCLSRVEVVPRL